MWTLLSKVAGVLLTILLWYLQELPKDSKEWYDIFLSKYKLSVAWLALFAAIIVYIIDTVANYCKRQNSIKKWSYNFLKHIVKEHLDGRDFQTRISILRPRKGYKIILQFCIIYPIKSFFLKHYKVCNKQYWNNIPYKIFDDYLCIYSRYGHSDNITSYTHFLITDRNEPCNGLADKCYKEGLEQEVCTVNISHINFANKYEKEDRDVKKYMSDSFIDKKYYSTFLSMNTKANNLYAVPIFYEDQRIWGVMMIDNDSDNRISYKEKLDSHIAMYQKIFSYTLQILK